MCHVKFGNGFLMLANFPTSDYVDALSPDVVGYFVIVGGQGTVNDIILIKNSSKKVKRHTV